MTKKTLELLEILRSKYYHEKYAFIQEFRGGTAWTRESRADAIVMGLWPSIGLELIGFELKVSRADWLREIKNPNKCEPIKQFCDQWYLVVYDGGICKDWDGELPDDWGYMIRDFDKILVKKEAPKLNPKPIDKPFLASIMRLASKDFQEVIIEGRKYKAIN